MRSSVPLGEVAKFINGRAFKPSDWVSSGLPIIRIQNLTNPDAPFNYYDKEVEEKYAVQNGDLLISWSATLDAFMWDRGPAILNQHIFRAIPNTSKIRKKFLYYAVTHVMDELRAQTHGVTMKHITRKPFEQTKIYLPPLAEQERIVRLLDEAESLRKLRDQASARMEKFIPALFHQMFGNKAELERKWKISKIGELTQVKTGGTPSRKELKYFQGNIPWVKTTEVNQSIITDTEEKITDEALKNNNCEIFPPETILIAMYGQGKTRGRTGKLGISATTNQACAAILPSSKFDSDYLWVLLQLAYKKLRDLGRGGNQPNMNLSMIKNFEVLLPPLLLQHEFVQRVQEAREIQSRQAQSAERIEALYQSMLSRAFAGEL